MAQAPTLSESMEDYLETIFLLIREQAVARSRDIAARLNVNRSSVTGALQALAERALVNYEPYGYVTLTPAGTEVAQKVVRRHEVLKDFLVKVLSIEETEAMPMPAEWNTPFRKRWSTGWWNLPISSKPVRAQAPTGFTALAIAVRKLPHPQKRVLYALY